MKLKIKKGDNVKVIAGSNKGKTGTVSLIIVDKNRAVIDGVNIVKKHTKPNPMKGEEGGIITKEMPIHQSNVAIFNASAGKADRVAIKQLEGGKRVRVFKSNGAEVA